MGDHGTGGEGAAVSAEELPLISGYILDQLCEHHDLIPHFVRSAERHAARKALEDAAEVYPNAVLGLSNHISADDARDDERRVFRAWLRARAKEMYDECDDG